jgi:hypothetical protein
MTMRRALGDVLLSACALSLLVAILMAFDGRVREQVRLRIDRPARASSDIVAVGTQLRDLGDVLLQSAKLQSQQHGSLMVLVACGTVLTIFMLRT